jgi:monoamine oxidase
MTTRRSFIKNTTLSVGGLLLAGSLPGSFFSPKKSKVIIIGGGFAGLAAAYSLHKKKIPFVLLEARNRIGGRVHSHTIDAEENLVVELGAEWVGNSHTRLQKLCAELGLNLLNNQFDTHLIYKGRYYNKTEWGYTDGWKQKFENLLKSYQSMSLAKKKELDKLDWWRYLVNNGCEGMDLDLRELTDSTDFGETIRQVSAFAALAEYAESSEKNEMDLKIDGGNGRLAQKLADAIGRDNILLQHPVTRVEQTGRGVKVTCGNGAVFSGDKIICTAPSFAVKNINWQPALPQQQIDALNQLQYARICKNPLLFSNRFWKDESFDMVTDQLPHYFYHATKNQKSTKGVLLSYTIGDKAAVVANQSNEWRKTMLQQTLEPHLLPSGGLQSILEKQEIYYWGNDEYSRGAYAIYGKGQWFTLQPILKKPHLHTFFAGEHLADWQGFMEGAINTGEEAASFI